MREMQRRDGPAVEMKLLYGEGPAEERWGRWCRCGDGAHAVMDGRRWCGSTLEDGSRGGRGAMVWLSDGREVDISSLGMEPVKWR